MAEKTIYEHAVGGDGAKVGAYVDEKNLSVKVSYPLAKIVDPVAALFDSAIDKVEQFIPGDQKGLAGKLKAEMREELAKLLASQVA